MKKLLFLFPVLFISCESKEKIDMEKKIKQNDSIAWVHYHNSNRLNDSSFNHQIKAISNLFKDDAKALKETEIAQKYLDSVIIENKLSSKYFRINHKIKP